MSQLFLDMDGVVADFNLAIHQFHGFDNVYKNPRNHGVWDIEKIWGIDRDAFWKADSLEFWQTVPKMEDADEIVNLVSGVFGVENIAILTAPSDGPGCVPGKKQWMAKHFPQFSKRMVFCDAKAKKFMAGVDKWLIDDKDSNVIEFDKNGGFSVLLPRHWNSDYKYSDSAVKCLAQRINLLKNG